MPSAIQTTPTSVPAPLTQSSLINGLRDALIAAGFPAILKQYTSGTDQFVVWELLFDNSKSYGKAYYRLKVTPALVVTHAIGVNFTDASNVLNSPSAESHNVTYLNNVPIDFAGFRTSEYLFLYCNQGALQQLLGYFRPPICPAFDESSFPKTFISTNADFGQVTCTALSPYGSTLTFGTSLGSSQYGGADLFLNRRNQKTRIDLNAPSNAGAMAQSSDDLAMGCCTGMTRGDIFEITGSNPVERFTVIRPGAGALLIKI